MEQIPLVKRGVVCASAATAAAASGNRRAARRVILPSIAKLANQRKTPRSRRAAAAVCGGQKEILAPSWIWRLLVPAARPVIFPNDEVLIVEDGFPKFA